MPVLGRAAALVVTLFIWLGSARAEPPGARVVLADPDPELRRAVEQSLKPWHLEVLVERDVPADLPAAQGRADARTARFVVWRSGGELVVYDRERNVAERRPAKPGVFDAIGAAAAALTVKTMMRLPPPPDADSAANEVDNTPQPVGPPSEGPPSLRFEAGPFARYEHGLDGNLALRFAIAAMVAPSSSRGVRFGVIADFGAAAQVDQAGFQGTWSNWAILARVGWTGHAAAWELEPYFAVGIEHSALEGSEPGGARDESTSFVTLRGGLAARYPIGAIRLGAFVGLEGLTSTLTYTRLETPAQIFEIPPFGVVTGVTIAADLSP